MSYPATADPVHWAFYLSRNDIVRANELERGIYDPFYIRCIICCIIPDPVHSAYAGGMDHWQVQSGAEGQKFPGHCQVIAIGEENIPTDTAVLYVGNHRSFFDVVLTYVRVPRPTGYVAKKEMLKWPLLNIWMKDLHCLFLDRQDIKAGLKTILAAIDKVKNGISICIFPEGTRNKTKDTFLPFHEGSFKIAEKGNVPIIPMTIVNSAAIFEDHFPKIKKATVVIEYGKPIYMKDLDKETRKSMGTYVQNIISETYFKNKELI